MKRLLLCLTSFCFSALAAFSANKPNVLLIAIDDLNDWTGMLKGNPQARTSLITFGYKNYGVRSERYRYIVYADGSEELYDHEKDKWEWNNLAANPEYAEIKKKMRKGLPAHHEPTGAKQ